MGYKKSIYRAIILVEDKRHRFYVHAIHCDTEESAKMFTNQNPIVEIPAYLRAMQVEEVLCYCQSFATGTDKYYYSYRGYDIYMKEYEDGVLFEIIDSHFGEWSEFCGTYKTLEKALNWIDAVELSATVDYIRKQRRKKRGRKEV